MCVCVSLPGRYVKMRGKCYARCGVTSGRRAAGYNGREMVRAAPRESVR